MKVHFLGTGAGMPSKQRNVTSIVLDLLHEINSLWLFDCGEATQHQILETSIKPRKIDKIFITHLHGDHIYGLPGLLSSRSFQAGESALTIFGPEGIADFVETSLRVSKTHLNYELEIEEIEDGVIVDDADFRVIAKKMEHGVDSFAYRIEQKDLKGSLLVEKLRALGIKPGPIYQQIKEKHIVEHPEHGLLQADQFIGPNKKGKVLTIFGDTRITEAHIPFAQDADVLIHEATFAADHEEMAYNYYHSTNRQTAMVAKEADVKKLILTHISSRYQDTDMDTFLEEAKSVFPHTEIAEDFQVYNF